MGVEKLFGAKKEPKGPSAAEMRASQEAAAKAEREKIQLEEAQQSAQERQDMQAAQSQQRSKRAAFAGRPEDEETSRRKFLRGV